MNIKAFSRVQFIGPVDDYSNLRIGAIGYVIETYAGGRYEVEFSDPDGTTWAQAVLAEANLVLAE